MLTSHSKFKDAVNIKFISGTIPFGVNTYINPAYWTLKSWYKRHGQNNNRINWLPAIYHNVGLNERVITEVVNTERPHILCFGLYLWNKDLYQRLGKFIKTTWPEIVLIGGGPEISAHKDLEGFWQTYDWLDVAIYGDGEEAFTLLIDNLLGSNTELINVSVPNKLMPFRRFKDKDFNTVSPFLDNIDDVKYAVSNLRTDLPNIEIRINWEFTKGCPYACSFCDWSSGLHHKVTRKEYDWKLDLDFLSSLDVTVRWADANIGMFKTDIDIIKYAYALEDKNPKFEFIFRDFAKLHKKAVFDIIDFIETSHPGKVNHFLTVQDINPTVLNNIDRPDVPWPVFKSHIIEMKNKHPSFIHSIEMMIGLPGQTLESFSESLLELVELDPKQILGHIWCMLINSPGYDKEYQKRFGIKTAPAYIISDIHKLTSRSEIAQHIDECEYYAADIVIETNTANISDIMAMLGMVYFYNEWHNMRSFHKSTFHKIIQNIPHWKNFGNDMEKILKKDLQSFSKILLLPEAHHRPVTFSTFFGTKDNLLSFIRSAQHLS